MLDSIKSTAPAFISLMLAINFVVSGTWQSALATVFSVCAHAVCIILIKSKGSDTEIAALKSKVEALTSEVKKHGLRLGFK